MEREGGRERERGGEGRGGEGKGEGGREVRERCTEEGREKDRTNHSLV